jgi:hypothetical protein
MPARTGPWINAELLADCILHVDCRFGRQEICVQHRHRFERAHRQRTSTSTLTRPCNRLVASLDRDVGLLSSVMQLLASKTCEIEQSNRIGSSFTLRIAAEGIQRLAVKLTATQGGRTKGCS